MTDPAAGGRFIPGTVLEGRYRIIGLLGRGGMGEVYRADDLKLGQAVALKWLPRDFEKDSSRLDRFLGEVRHSLKVTHPNVCRVFDVGEADGQHYLSMEFVDGEDLASLLLRIGRLPEDKAVQVARHLCAGLAAAHDEGVLHRDMKPANVMIDGRGRTKITDFGLAGATEGITGAEARAGTPGYMAPEQIAGGELSTRTDIYSLGLVLYELFTGKQAYEAKSLAEMARLQRTTPSTLSSHVENLDPTIESVIMRCLAHDPEQRPESAETVALALPGGDPLAAAVAAGETPSPDMIAAAGGRGGLSARTAWMLLGSSLLGLALAVVGLMPEFLIDYLEPDKPPAVLIDDARELLRSLELYDARASDAAGSANSSKAVQWLKQRAEKTGERSWYAEGIAQVPWLRFWYRQRDGSLAGQSGYGYTRFDNPSFGEAGEARVMLDHRSRLLTLEVVPDPDAELTIDAPPFDWTPLLTAAGVDIACLEPVEPRSFPTVFADARFAWEGTCEGWPTGPVRIEAASLAGRPVQFHVDEPWSVEEQVAPSGALPWFTIVNLGLLIGAAVLARRNLRAGRSDLRGANVIFAVYIAGHTVSILPILELSFENLETILAQLISTAGYNGAFLWLAYLALEPSVRRRWPSVLVSWSRLLQGGLTDPLVGRDVLLGALGGVLLLDLFSATGWIQRVFGIGPFPDGIFPGGPFLDSALHSILGVLHGSIHSIEVAMTVLLVFVLVTMVLRKTPVAVSVLVGTLALLGLVGPQGSWIGAVLGACAMGIFLTLVLRAGFLAAAVAFCIVALFARLGISAHFGAWYGFGSLVALITIVLVAGYGFWVALAGRPMFGNVE